MNTLIKQVEQATDFGKRFFDFDDRQFYSSVDLIEQLGFSDPFQLEDCISRAMRACRSLNIPVDHNFRKVYAFDGASLVTQWRLSSLASYLVVINGDPGNSKVAEAQLYFFTHKSTNP